MALIANYEGVRIRATNADITRAKCPDRKCDAPMYRRAPANMRPHWTHNPGTAERCEAPRGETVWHYDWKDECLDVDRIEAVVGTNRADVLTRFGWAIEFQHSGISRVKLRERENAYGGKLIWVHDATTDHGGTVRNVQEDGNFEWIAVPPRVQHGRCHQLVDLPETPWGEKRLLWLPSVLTLDASRNALGRGRLVTHQWFIETWLNGDTLEYPLGVVPLTLWEQEASRQRRTRSSAKPRPWLDTDDAAVEDGSCDWNLAGRSRSDQRERPAIPNEYKLCGCGRPLLLVRPGRVQCELCRLKAIHGSGAA